MLTHLDKPTLSQAAEAPSLGQAGYGAAAVRGQVMSPTNQTRVFSVFEYTVPQIPSKPEEKRPRGL